MAIEQLPLVSFSEFPPVFIDFFGVSKGYLGCWKTSVKDKNNFDNTLFVFNEYINRAMTITIHADDYNSNRAKIVVSTGSWRFIPLFAGALHACAGTYLIKKFYKTTISEIH